MVSFLAIASGLAEAVALTLAVRVVVDIGAGSSGVQLGALAISVRAALLIAVVAEAIALACHALIARSAARIGATVLHESRRIALSRYVHAPWKIQSVQREGALQELVSTLSFRTSEVAQWLAYGLGQALILLMFVVAAFAVDWRFTLFILGAGTTVVFLIRPLARKTQVKAKEFVDSNSFYVEEVGRIASATMELKSFGVGTRAESQLERINQDVGVRFYRSRFSALFAGNLFKDVAVFLLIGSVAALYWLGRDALASAGVVITLIIRGLASAQQASSLYQNISETVPNLQAFEKRVAAMHQETLPTAGAEIGSFRSIELRNVGYAYDDAETAALRAVSFEINSGDFVGIVGPSGGGKSTLLQLILRLRLPTSGEIDVNGVNYTEISADDWHDFVSLVPQEPSLLEASIAENIAYYRPISLTKIHEAAHAANIFDEIMKLPGGFDHRLGPRGSGLSGGQKQRIAIARAVAGDPSLLVMDEPTSALDSRSEDAVLETIFRLRGTTTIILVAHRLSTVEHCDRLIQVIEGQVEQVVQTSTGGNRHCADVDSAESNVRPW